MRALVTGVTRGIGRSLVDHLVAGGATVAAVGRRADALAPLAAAWGPAVTPYVADVVQPGALEAVVESFGDVDLAIASAGALTGTGRTWEADPAEWWAGVEVNLRGVHHTAHAVLPGMVARGSGRLVLVTSGMGNRPGAWITSYASSKAALTTYGASVEQELDGTGAHVFLISPGMVRTDMTRWPDPLTRHVPELADLPDEAFTPVSALMGWIDVLASGRADPLAGRFLHATDDIDALLAAVDPGDPRPRTLRLAPAHDDDPHAR